jgi:iron complex transport system ATP-binding protein
VIALRARSTAIPERRPIGATLAQARQVEVTLGGTRVLDGVDLVARAGELVALVGPNGAGKSTLLASLTGDVRPDAGDVLVDDRPLPSWSHTELAMRRAVLPQQVTVTFPFTVTDVVQMGRVPWARTPAADLDDIAVRGALADADVAHLAERHVPSLSGGERARVALARVLAQATQLVLLDEPTAALDIHHQEHVLSIVRERVTAGDGAVVVLHDLALAAAYADRIAVLADGRVVADGPPEQVLAPDLLSAVYEHDIDVVRHPETGELLVLPRRSDRSARTGGPGRPEVAP